MEHKKVYFLQFFLLYSFIAFAAFRLYNISIHPDTAWLAGCAKRFLSGISLLEGCYDTNPPLSILIYTPAVYLSQLSGIALYYCIYITIFIFIALCVLSTHILITKLSFLSLQERFIFLVTYTTFVIIVPLYDFTQRDHLIAVALVPFLLAQYTITKKIPTRGVIRHLSLALGTLMILVKPHYGLLPVMVLIHRYYTQKRISLDLDFMYLALSCLTYAFVLYIYFPDFLTIVLPDVIHYYLPYKNESDVNKFLLPFILPSIMLCLAIVYKYKNEDDKRDFLLFFWLGTFTAMISYYVQAKGFYYQLIPTRTFFYITLFVLSYSILSLWTKTRIQKEILTYGLCSLIVAYPAHRLMTFTSSYATHSFFQNAPLTKYIEKECGSPCSFFITYPHMSLNNQTIFYIDKTYASRFPAYWFYPVMQYSLGIPKAETETPQYQKRVNTDKERFTRYIIEDMKKYKPNIILLYKDPPEQRGMQFDFFDYFSGDANFRKLRDTYVKTGEFTTERSDYFHGTSMDYPYTLRWDVYKRVENFAPEQQRNKNNE